MTNGIFTFTAVGALSSFERITVTRLALTEGEGTSESPFRRVVYWVTDDGEVIARIGASS